MELEAHVGSWGSYIGVTTGILWEGERESGSHALLIYYYCLRSPQFSGVWIDDGVLECVPRLAESLSIL